ncbi:MAG TPA: WbqC family protein [Methanocellaceae archaeon]
MIKAAIIQSSYIPWKGYFDIIHDVDKFVFLEDVQYTKHDWRSRNRVKTPGGVKWLSVPVTGGICQKICEAKIDNSLKWSEKHMRTIHHSYAACDHYRSYSDDIFRVLNKKYETISDLNMALIKKLSSLLGIETELINSRDLEAPGTRDDRLISICERIGADSYLSGPAAKDYIVQKKFDGAGLKLEYKNYDGYPEYEQPWGAFDPFISVIDLIFCCGERAPYYIWGWRRDRPAIVEMAKA